MLEFLNSDCFQLVVNNLLKDCDSGITDLLFLRLISRNVNQKMIDFLSYKVIDGIYEIRTLEQYLKNRAIIKCFTELKLRGDFIDRLPDDVFEGVMSITFEDMTMWDSNNYPNLITESELINNIHPKYKKEFSSKYNMPELYYDKIPNLPFYFRVEFVNIPNINYTKDILRGSFELKMIYCGKYNFSYWPELTNVTLINTPLCLNNFRKLRNLDIEFDNLQCFDIGDLEVEFLSIASSRNYFKVIAKNAKHVVVSSNYKGKLIYLDYLFSNLNKFLEVELCLDNTISLNLKADSITRIKKIICPELQKLTIQLPGFHLESLNHLQNLQEVILDDVHFWLPIHLTLPDSVRNFIFANAKFQYAYRLMITARNLTSYDIPTHSSIIFDIR